MGGPNQGTRADGSAPRRPRPSPGAASPHHASRRSPPIDPPIARWTSIGSPATAMDPSTGRERLRIDHGHPAQIVEKGEMADLVPHRPSLGGRRKVPLRCVVVSRRRQGHRGRRTRHRGRPGARRAWSRREARSAKAASSALGTSSWVPSPQRSSSIQCRSERRTSTSGCDQTNRSTASQDLLDVAVRTADRGETRSSSAATARERRLPPRRHQSDSSTVRGCASRPSASP